MKDDSEIKGKEFPKFRDSLFWDTDQDSLDPNYNDRWIIERVMHRGEWEEWQKIRSFYGDDRIRKIIPKIKWQDPKTENYFKLIYS